MHPMMSYNSTKECLKLTVYIFVSAEMQNSVRVWHYCNLSWAVCHIVYADKY